ncbi:MAG: DUF2066 domain-containing protein [Hyphomicrobium sp.]
MNSRANGHAGQQAAPRRALRVGALAGMAALWLLGTVAALPVLAASPADKVFTVADYPVEATESNAVAAKDRAMAEGQTAAFRSLLKRIVPVTAYKQLARLKGVKAGDLLSGVSVRSEQTSSTTYIASLDFAFQADAVRNLLNHEGIAFVDGPAAEVTLVALRRDAAAAPVKSDTGAWKRAWSGLDLKHTVTPLALADLKATVHNDTVTMLLNGDGSAQRILTGEYQSERVVLALAEPDTAAKTLVVTLVGQDATGPLNLKRTYRVSDGDFTYASELAAVVALGVLEGRWKAVSSRGTVAEPYAAPPVDVSKPVWSAGGQTAASGGDAVALVAEFTSLAQWNEIRTQLLDTPGVDGLEIASVSARNADLALTFPGGAAALANALGGRGLALVNNGAVWTLRPNF